MHIFSLLINHNFSWRMIKIIKGITERKIIKRCNAIKNSYVVTYGVREVILELLVIVWLSIPLKSVGDHWNQGEKGAYKQMKIFDFQQFLYHWRDGTNILSCSHLGKTPISIWIHKALWVLRIISSTCDLKVTSFGIWLR